MQSKPRHILLLAMFIPWLCPPSPAAETEAVLPQYAAPKHMGVATCGNSVCHGVRDLDTESNVRQNEYHTWLLDDPHSKAYDTLLSAESKAIAEKLGLESAASAGICLDCHADNVPEEKRGPEFHITDGVGCESCHGGAEQYISTHTIQPYSLERNLRDGMYPTGNLSTRTTLCTSCHVGTANKLANHNIMGAGHPRLSFELDTFMARQEFHYDVDKDYLARKNNDSSITRMMVGSAALARATAKNLTGKLVDHPQGYPEVALFNCHSCHRSLNEQNWKSRPSTVGLKPGSVRINDGSFILLAAVSGGVDKRLQDALQASITQLHRASRVSTEKLKQSAMRLAELTEQAESTFSRTVFNEGTGKTILGEIARYGANGEFLDYIAAEQAVMAMEAVYFQFPSDRSLEATIDKAFEITSNEENFDPDAFKALMKKLRSKY